MIIHSNLPAFEPALFARYDVAGASYTSYPTAPKFKADFDETALCGVIRASNEEPIPRPLSLHLHMPFSGGLPSCCGCNRLATDDVIQTDRYLERVYREIERIAPLFDRDRSVQRLQFAGSMPKGVASPDMTVLLESLAHHFSFSRESGREYAIEVDPCSVDGNDVRRLGQLGFNRISVGIQDFDPVVQSTVQGLAQLEQTREIIHAARESSFRSISVGLMYGLPCQSVDGFRRTLAHIVELNPDRIMVHDYAHLLARGAVRRQDVDTDLPDDSTRLALLDCALADLTGAGYIHLGMGCFASNGDELVLAQRAGTLQRSFEGYTTHGGCDIVGLGVGGIGRIGDNYTHNVCDLTSYCAALDAGRLPLMGGLQLGEDDLIRRELIDQLLCHGVLDKRVFGARHRLLFDAYFVRERQRLQRLIADGLVRESDREIRVTSPGRLLLRIIAMCFDAYLDEAAQTSRFSRVI